MTKAKNTNPDEVAKTANQKLYNPYLDVLKGVAIVLVVLGHAVQFAPGTNYDSNILFRVIYSFHMPLFMFLSGAAAAYSLRPMNADFLKRKFYQLVVPFIAWYLIGYFLGGAYHNIHFITYIHRVIDSPDYGLWFLWVLFLNFCSLAFIRKLEPRLKLYAYPLVWLAIYAIPTGKYGIGLVKWHLPFFIVGYLIFHYRERLKKYSKIPGTVSLLSFPVLALTWHRLYNPAPIAHLNAHLAAHHLSAITIGGIATFNVYPILVLLYTYTVAFSGIGFTYTILALRPAKYLYGLFGFLGLYTLDIYVSQAYFFRFAVGHSWLAIVTGFMIALGLSLALGIIVLRRVPLLSVVFLGGRAKAPKLWRRQRADQVL